MWRWSRKKLHRKALFFLQLFLFVLVLHVLIGLSMTWYYLRNQGLGDIFINKDLMNKKASFKVLPFARHVNRKQLLKALASKPKAKKKAPVKKKPKKPAIIKKKPIKKAVEKKPPVKPIEKKKEEPKKVSEPKKKIEKEVKKEEPIYIGKDDMTLLQIQDEVLESLKEKWTPPTGIVPKNPCRITVSVGKKGETLSFAIQESSGILAYDMAAQLAVSEAEFPKRVWNNEFTLNF